VLVAIALEPEVGMAHAEVAGATQSGLRESLVGQRQERRIDLARRHADDPNH